jgi:DNA replication protein DnaD
VHHKESLEEMEDSEAIDTKEEMKQSCAALEVISEYHVATTEQDSVETNNTEISETHNSKITLVLGRTKWKII